MAKELGVTPSDLRATHQHLDDVSARMKDVLSSLREKLRAEGAPWGGGKIGDQFANGDNGDDGFVAQMEWVDQSVDAKTGLLDYYSRALKGAADSFEQHDEA
jgi:uncharacterized protein YukE